MTALTKKIIAYLVGISLILSIGIWLTADKKADTGNSNSQNYSASLLKPVDKSFDFGTVTMEKGKVFHEFRLVNEGGEPVKIEKVYTSCMCTTAEIIDQAGKKRGLFGMPGHGLSSRANVEVNAGESVTIKAIFDPNAHGPSGVGLAQRSIFLETNSAKSPKVELKFSAVVTK